MSEAFPTPPSPEDKPISLKELLSYDNPNKGRYEEIIQEVADSQRHFSPGNEAVKTSFAEMWWYDALEREGENRLLDYLKEKLGGETLIDLGGSYGSMLDEAKMTGVKTYIAVDKFLESEKPIDPYSNIWEGKYKKNDPNDPDMLLVQADILDFISKLPDGSVNITLNGIDGSLIPNREYHEALASEILRVTKEGGVIFGIQASSIELDADDPSVLRKDPKREFGDKVGGAIILEKRVSGQ